MILPQIKEAKDKTTDKLARTYNFENISAFKFVSLFKELERKNILSIDLQATNKITLLQDESMTKSEEYKIIKKEGDIDIYSNTYPGFVHAIATLSQEIIIGNEHHQWVHDYADFDWRGVSLDISRHYFNKEDIMKLIFATFIYKGNKFQLHLTDDQGWRIEIKSYPKLTQLSSYKMDNGYDNTGFLTQEEVSEIVEYGMHLGVEIIPEIDMPGHTEALVFAYPELMCEGHDKVQALSMETHVRENVICISNPIALEMFKMITHEVSALFNTTKYFHIGGDECPSKHWETCDKCQNAMKEKGFNTPWQLQKWFSLEIIEHLKLLNKEVIIWDDLIENEMIDDITVECWREWMMRREGYCERIINSGAQFINMANENVYFDWYQDEKQVDPNLEKFKGWITPLERVHDFSPLIHIPKELHEKVIGSSCAIWTDRMPDMQKLETMCFPRMIIFFNSLWNKNKCSFDEMTKALEVNVKILEHLEIEYYK